MFDSHKVSVHSPNFRVQQRTLESLGLEPHLSPDLHRSKSRSTKIGSFNQNFCFTTFFLAAFLLERVHSTSYTYTHTNIYSQLLNMFKRVAKATSRKADVEDLRDATGDDTAIGIDKLVDDSSSSEGEDSDNEEDEDESDDEDDEDERDAENSKAGSKRKRTKEQDEEEEVEAAARVTIEDAIKDPIYVPTEGEKKHGIFASRCIVCEAAVLKTSDLVSAHLEAKAHKRRMGRFQRYVQEQLSEDQRKAIDARDAVDQMDAWRAQQDELHKKKQAEAPPSRRALAKKQKAAEFRKKKKEQALKRKAAKEAAPRDKDAAKKDAAVKPAAKKVQATKRAKKDT